MALFTTLYSGSSGNCGLVREGNQYLLVDMGKSCRTTLTALRRLDLAISDCAGILVTHEHSDHVAGHLFKKVSHPRIQQCRHTGRTGFPRDAANGCGDHCHGWGKPV